MKEIQIERALRISGVLLILGIVVEIISLLWEKPLAFLLFVGVGGALTFVGIILYLYSCCHPLSNLRRNPDRKTLSSTSEYPRRWEVTFASPGNAPFAFALLMIFAR